MVATCAVHQCRTVKTIDCSIRVFYLYIFVRALTATLACPYHKCLHGKHMYICSTIGLSIFSSLFPTDNIQPI